MYNRKLFSSSDDREILDVVVSLTRGHCDGVSAQIVEDRVTEWLECKRQCDEGDDVKSRIEELEGEVEGLESQLDDVRAAVQ